MTILKAPLQARTSWMPKWNPPADCVLYLPGQDDAYSSTIRDRSGNGNNGTIYGATWTQLPSGLWYLNYDGTNDYVALASSITLTIGTYMFWAKPDNWDTWQSFMNSNRYLSSISLQGNPDGRHLLLETDTDNQYFYFTNLAATVGPWQFVAVSRNGDNATGYINSTTQSIYTAGANVLTISRLGMPFSGTIYGAMAMPVICNTALSYSQVISWYHQTRKFFGV